MFRLLLCLLFLFHATASTVRYIALANPSVHGVTRYKDAAVQGIRELLGLVRVSLSLSLLLLLFFVFVVSNNLL